MGETLFTVLMQLLFGWTVVYLLIGVLLGLGVGILPGLGGTVGLALVLPFVFGMEPVVALAMMTGLLAVVTTGDTIASILMGIPGSASSQATVLDGFPLAKKGQAARALSAAFICSMAGGLIGAAILTGAISVARPIILAFGTGEMLLLVVLGLTMVSVLSGNSLLKGVMACGVGMALGAVGPAPATGEYRLTLGSYYLTDGLHLVVVGLAVFAIPEMVDLLRRAKPISTRMLVKDGWIQGLRDFVQHKWIVIRCSAMGAVLGALPGIGGSVVDWIAYGHVVQSARDRSKFGDGDIRGVIGPESTNNATNAGALVPTMIFGIPGSGSTALFLGGLILLGIQPGVMMVTQELHITYTIIWSLALANVFGAGICFLISSRVARLTAIPYVYLAPFMVMIIFFAAFQASRQLGDLVSLFVIGAFATYMRRFGYPRPALLIGFVLQDSAERYFYQSMQYYSILDLLQRPLFLVLSVIIALSLFFGLKFRPRQSTEGVWAARTSDWLGPQIGFLLLITGIFVYVLIDVWANRFLGKVFPLTIVAICLAVVVAGILALRNQNPENPMVFDAEANRIVGHNEEYTASLHHYLFWIGGFVAAVYFVGYMLATLAFFLVILSAKSPARPWAIAVMTASALGFLTLLAHLLVLRFPQGLLQSVVDLPWPL